jgi:hypothetical protein
MNIAHFLTGPNTDTISSDKSLNERRFTFVKFFEYINEMSMLTKDDVDKFSTLFEIYCKKLVGSLPCASSQPPPQWSISSQSNDSESTSNSGNHRKTRRHRKTNRKYLLRIVL